MQLNVMGRKMINKSYDPYEKICDKKLRIIIYMTCLYLERK